MTHNEQIALKLVHLRENAKSKSYPTDQQISELAELFYQRDRRKDKIDIEMLAVSRGISQGMKLMRQIIDPV